MITMYVNKHYKIKMLLFILLQILQLGNQCMRLPNVQKVILMEQPICFNVLAINVYSWKNLSLHPHELFTERENTYALNVELYILKDVTSKILSNINMNHIVQFVTDILKRGPQMRIPY